MRARRNTFCRKFFQNHRGITRYPATGEAHIVGECAELREVSFRAPNLFPLEFLARNAYNPCAVMSSDNFLPPEFQPLLDELAVQPDHVRAMWQYALVLMMIDDEKARVIDSTWDGEQLSLNVQTVTGERFTIVRPSTSEETERVLLEQIRSIVEEDCDRSKIGD